MKSITKKIIANILIINMFVILTLSNLTTTVFAGGAEDYFFDSFKITEIESYEGRTFYNLDWEDYEFPNQGFQDTNYHVARVPVNAQGDEIGQWELRGNYSNSNIRVLNIYPNVDGSDQLKDWMDNMNALKPNINIEVTPLDHKIATGNLEAYLYKDDDERYNYDVVVFGFWDNNNHYDLDEHNAEVIQEFIDDGGGVLFGHDTARYEWNDPKHPVFEGLVQENTDILITRLHKSRSFYSNEIAVRRQSSYTSFPFNIEESTLDIPMSHNVGQLPSNPDTAYLTFVPNYYENGKGPYYHYYLNKQYAEKYNPSGIVNYKGDDYVGNAYLIVDGNVGLIQTGHSEGESSLDEQKILANVIYGLAQINTESHSADQVIDNIPPLKPQYTKLNNGLELAFSSSDDIKTNYKYKILASPLGYSIQKNWEDIEVALSNNEKLFDDDLSSKNTYVIFTDSKTVSTTSGLKDETDDFTFKYVVDKNETSEITTIIDSGEPLKINETYTIDYNNITSDVFLHSIAYDKANNISDVSTINLFDVLPDFGTVARYQTLDGTDIIDAIATRQKVGTTFTPDLLEFENFFYNSVEPSHSITVSAEEPNEVTHYYDREFTKDFYTVQHRLDSDGNPIMIENKYESAKFIENGYSNVEIQQFHNHEFLGYYTIGDLTSNRVDVDPLSTDVDILYDNEEPIYFHYNLNSFDAKINIVREDDNSNVLATITKQGYANEPVFFTGAEIENLALTEIPDLDNYTNKYILKLPHKIVIDENSSNTIDLALKPRSVLIIHYGVEFPETTRATTKLAPVLLAREILTYQNDTIVNISDQPQISADGWTMYDDEPSTVDFSENKSTVNVGYYKGTLPSETYEYHVNYINNHNHSHILGTYDSPLLNVYKSSSIDLPDYSNVITSGSAVDFEPYALQITHNPTGSTTNLLDVHEDYLEYLPYYDETTDSFYNGRYTVNVYYKPYSIVTINEQVVDEENNILFDTSTQIELLLDTEREYVYNSDFDSKYYSITNIDGATLVNDGTNDIRGFADEYYKTINITYTPKKYNLNVRVISNTDTTVSNDFYVYENISLQDSVKFNIPIIPGYSFDKIESNSEEYLTELGDSVYEFLPQEEGDYIIDLYFDEQSEININYNVIDINGNISLYDSVRDIGYINKPYTATIPSGSDMDYTLLTTYVDGNRFDNLEQANSYEVVIHKPEHQAELFYIPIKDKTLTVSSMEGGYINILEETEMIVDELATNQRVLIEVYVREGYKFLGWENIGAYDATIENPSETFTHIVMPNGNASVRARFEKLPEKYDVILASTKGGYVTEDKNHIFVSSEHSPNEKVTITAYPKLGYKFVKWENYGENEVDIDSTTSKTATVTINHNDVYLRAIFEKGNIVIDNGGDEDDDEDEDEDGDDDYVDEIENPETPIYPDIPNVNFELGELFRKTMPYIQGYEDNTIQPDSEITRSEFITIIYNLYGHGYVPNVESLSKFSDVESDMWYSEAISFATEIGIVNGYEDGTFQPNKNITRGEIAYILAKFIVSNNMDLSTNHFTDEEGWYRDSIEILFHKGITNGYSDNTFRPNLTATRAEVVTFTNRLIDRNLNYERTNTFIDLQPSHWAYDNMMNASNGVNISE